MNISKSACFFLVPEIQLEQIFENSCSQHLFATFVHRICRDDAGYI